MARLPRLPPPREWPRSAWLLALANVVPLAGVILLGWELGAIMLLFWAENAIIGVFHVFRIALVAGWSALFLVPFFALHYGIFTAVHGIFVFTLFAQGSDLRIVVPGIAALFLSHGASFVLNFLRGGEMERLRQEMRPQPSALRGEPWAAEALSTVPARLTRTSQTATALMAAPYKRVVVLHLTIIAGGFLMASLGSPAYALALLVVLKTAVDLAAHLHERARHGPP